MKKMIAVVILLAMVIAPGMAFAASPWTQETSYGDKVAAKLDFGIKNLLGGWTEIYNEPMAVTSEGVGATIGGLFKGIANAVAYTLGGAIHTATFPIPVDIPIPNNGLDV